jgi:haloalkane dehalogenase
MDVLRTPEHRFADVPGYDHPPRYVEVDAGDGSPRVRMAYVDVGEAAAPVCLMLHGEPSWGFLYRRVVDAVVAAGYRAVVPDLIGFGRSDKPADPQDYTYARHVAWVRSFLHELALSGVTLLCQDWGGLIGLRIVGQQPERFAAVVAANTFLPVGAPAPQAFLDWQRFSQGAHPFPVGFVLQNATETTLPPQVVAAYEAPFPDESFTAGARRFPMLVPTEPDDPGAVDNREAWPGLAAFDRPFVTAFSDGDPVTRGGDRVLQERVAGAAGQPHVVLAGGGHFLQEDVGPQLAEVVVATLRRAGAAGASTGNAGTPPAV